MGWKWPSQLESGLLLCVIRLACLKTHCSPACSARKLSFLDLEGEQLLELVILPLLPHLKNSSLSSLFISQTVPRQLLNGTISVFTGEGIGKGQSDNQFSHEITAELQEREMGSLSWFPGRRKQNPIQHLASALHQ